MQPDNSRQFKPFTLEEHCEFMHKALEIGKNCHDMEFYGVGCVIVAPNRTVISTGFSGELKETVDGITKDRHAEDVAILKAKEQNHSLTGAILYSTLEPCSIRKSGRTPCSSRIIDSEISIVVYGASEPFDPAIGVVCEGDAVMRSAGKVVVQLTEMADECWTAARGARRPTIE